MFAHMTGVPHHAEEITLLRALIWLAIATGPVILFNIKSWFNKKGK